MNKKYTSPIAELVEFDAKDVITTSENSIIFDFTGEAANQEAGWTGLY